MALSLSKMVEKYLLDTSVLVEYRNNNPAALALLNSAKHVTSAIAVMEFNQGKSRPFSSIFPSMTVLPFTKAEAMIAAQKMVQIRAIIEKQDSKKASKDRAAILSLDTMIAATAINRKYSIVTTNPIDFLWFENLKIHTLT